MALLLVKERQAESPQQHRGEGGPGEQGHRQGQADVIVHLLDLFLLLPQLVSRVAEVTAPLHQRFLSYFFQVQRPARGCWRVLV